MTGVATYSDLSAEVMRRALAAVEAPTSEEQATRLGELGALVDELCDALADLAQRCEHLDAV